MEKPMEPIWRMMFSREKSREAQMERGIRGCS